MKNTEKHLQSTIGYQILKDHSNKVFYKLTVVGKIEVYNGHYRWICRCECGKEIIVQGSHLTNGYKKSCGCWRKPPNKPDFVSRFWKFVEKTSTCWNWVGSKCFYGYGQLSIQGKPKRANRISYEMHKGEIPIHMFVCHSCDNPSCVNPDHLWLGNQKDNMKDMKKKNRQNICKGSGKPQSKLKENDITQIRIKYKNPLSSSELAKFYGVSKQNILDIINRKAWKHVL